MISEAIDNRRWRIAKTLKEARAKTSPKLSQAEIARQVAQSGLTHVTERHISRFELGYMEASTAEAKSIAAVLGVSTDWLCGHAPAVSSSSGSTVAGVGLARAAETQSPPSTKTVVASPPASKWPPCPGPSAMVRGNEESDSNYRARLIELRAQTQKMLHTSGLPAAEWRQWRELERLIADALRNDP
ncbi:MAG TPA: helix-turn-helix transcriptional regulator [Opitutaceae bacterium]|nr:helix-turn-helix transcriptional regulator [Opitutaceae bacterium]